MVVCESGFVASTVASIMMNGVCCLWQMEEENDRQLKQREAIRRDIRVEYERQRQIEQELWEQRHQCWTENWYNDASSVNTDQRRRKLIADKRRLSIHSQDGSTNSQSSGSSRRSASGNEEPRQGPALVQKLASPLSRQPIKKRRVRIASPQSAAEFPVVDCYGPKSPQDMSSLMDSAFDEEGDDDDEGDYGHGSDVMMEEEITSLVDIPLR